MNARIKLTAAAAALVALGGLTGCAGGAGGKTTCGDFGTMTAGDRQSVVAKMIQDHGGNASDIDVREMSIRLEFFCVDVSADATIDGVYATES